MTATKMYTAHLGHILSTSRECGRQVAQCNFMPYPAKTDRQTILAAAMEQLTCAGLRSISLRSLAASLALAPNALYRYFADRAQLEAALAEESARRLHAVLRRAVGRRQPSEAIRSLARAYIKFARNERHLYETLMLPALGSGECAARSDLWLFVVNQVARLSGPSHAREAAVALWAFLHGMTVLEAANVFGEEKPASSFEFGLNSWLATVSGIDRTSN
jgi:AcrR family transcriptional regulator